MSRILGAILIVAIAVPAWAESVRQLDWTDLVPPIGTLEDPLADQPMDVRYDLGFVAKVFSDAERGLISKSGPEYMTALALHDGLRSRGLDVDRLVRAIARRDAEIARRQAAVIPELDGQVVRLPGYALPLTLSGTGVREMLLVPYVGACIHVPPPPPNQIVHATLAETWEMEGLYEPVWITGRLEVRSSSPSLSFVDGQAGIETGYAMQVEKVEPYE